jgi:hypothetical protein
MLMNLAAQRSRKKKLAKENPQKTFTARDLPPPTSNKVPSIAGILPVPHLYPMR